MPRYNIHIKLNNGEAVTLENEVMVLIDTLGDALYVNGVTYHNVKEVIIKSLN